MKGNDEYPCFVLDASGGVEADEVLIDLTNNKSIELNLPTGPDARKVVTSHSAPIKFNFEQAVTEFSEVLSEADIKPLEKITTLLQIAASHLGLSIGVLAHIEDEHSRIDAISGFDSLTMDKSLHGVGSYYPLSDSFCRETLKARSIFSKRIVDAKSSPPVSSPYRSYIGVPVTVGGALYGTLFFASPKPRALDFTKSEKRYVALISRYIGNEIGCEQVQRALTYRVDFEKLLTSISINFINLAPKQIDSGICNALKSIAEFSDVDFSYVFQFRDGNTFLDFTHWWFRDGSEPNFRRRDISVEKYSVSLQRILSRGVVYMPDVEKLPKGAERRFCRSQGVRSGVMVPMVASGQVIGFLGFAWKVTRPDLDSDVIQLLQMVGCTLANAIECKRGHSAVCALEEQVRNAQKLESLGILAGGVAHDFNNLLMGILGNVGLALDDIDPESSAMQNIKTIEKIAQHAAGLTHQLLAYSGNSPLITEVLDLSEVIGDMTELLDTVVAKKHKLKWDLSDTLRRVEGDASQIGQVLLNLVINASEAIGEAKGTISVNTGLIAVDEEYLRSSFLGTEIEPGVYSYLQVSDTGCGMDEKQVSRIFDPFFTSKTSGHGLGLAAVLGIIRRHGGTINVTSELGKGTCFTVLFPCAEKQFSVVERAESRVSRAANHKTVLIVDDESSIRFVLSEFLKRHGYEVLSAQDGAAAIDIFKLNRARIATVVLDATMPDMDGAEVIDVLRGISAEVKIILSSGFSAERVTKAIPAGSCDAFLKKPYNPKVLLDAIAGDSG